MIDRVLELVSAKILLGVALAALAALALVGWLYTGALEDLGAARSQAQQVADASDGNLKAFEGCTASLADITGKLATAGTKLAAAEGRIAELTNSNKTLSDRLRAERARQRATDPTYASWSAGPVPAGVFERLRAANGGAGGAAPVPRADAGPPPGAPDPGPAGGRDP